MKQKIGILFSVLFSFGIWTVLWSEETYDIPHITVDVTARSALEARTQALAQGYEKAWKALLESLGEGNPPTEIGSLPSVKIEPLVQDFEIVNERVSPVRYLATLNFRFNPQAVQKFLTQKEQSSGSSSLSAPSTNSFSPLPTPTSSRTPRHPMLLVPILIKNDQIYLWEEENPWFSLCAQTSPTTLAETEIPLGDLGDVATLSGQDILDGNQDKINALMRRYGAGALLVSLLHFNSNEGQLEVIQYTRHGAVHHSDPLVLGPGDLEPSHDLLQKALQKTIQVVQEFDQQSLDSPAPTRLEAWVPFNNYSMWRIIREKLEKIPNIQKVRVTRLNRRDALVEVTYRRTHKSLEALLSRGGLSLVPSYSPSDSTPSPKVPPGAFEGPTLQKTPQEKLTTLQGLKGASEKGVSWKLILNSKAVPSPSDSPPPPSIPQQEGGSF